MAEHKWRMIKANDGSYHRVCINCKPQHKQTVSVKRKTGTTKAKPAAKKPVKVSVRFVKQYTSPGNGRIFRQYERTDTGRRVDIIMRDDRQALYNYTQAEATAEARRRLA